MADLRAEAEKVAGPHIPHGINGVCECGWAERVQAILDLVQRAVEEEREAACGLVCAACAIDTPLFMRGTGEHFHHHEIEGEQRCAASRIHGRARVER